jgi:metal-responsive CopG/Arc/MetJ family transcriptional regulator
MDTEEAEVTSRTSTAITERSYKTFTVGIDENLDRTIDELKEKFGKTSRADVFRMGIALLKVAAEAKDRGLKLTISDRDDVVKKEILIA